jgi:hypothetical protein
MAKAVVGEVEQRAVMALSLFAMQIRLELLPQQVRQPMQ